jgi:coxsackievirus/adenovirus receptor
MKMVKMLRLPALLAVCILAASIPAALSTSEPCVCPRIFRQVCGADQRTYDNACQAIKCARTTVLYEGPCTSSGRAAAKDLSAGTAATTAPAATKPPTKLCPCPRIYLPVCDAAGNRYNNECLAKCAGAVPLPCNTGSAAAAGGLEAAKKLTTTPAAPKEKLPAPVCACPMIYRPVCGSDGITYPNDCLFTRCRTPDFTATIVHQGPCKQPAAAAGAAGAAATRPTISALRPMPGACACPRIYRPVCGSDGMTYSNDCELTRCRALDNIVTVAYQGPCQGGLIGGGAGNFQQRPINDIDLRPILGSGFEDDDETPIAQWRAPITGIDSSRQPVQGAGTTNPGTPTQKLPPQGGVTGNGVGGTSAVTRPPACACTLQYAPVCGTDGKTYGNDCVFTRCKDPSSTVTIAYRGPCKN